MTMDEVIDRQMRGEPIAMAVLLEASFKSETKYLWNGVGPISISGKEWQGVGDILSISPVRRGENGQADPFEVEIFATPEILQLGISEFDAEGRDQPLSVYLQFFGATDQLPIGSRWQIRRGVMRGAALLFSSQERTFTIACDTITSTRGRPAYGQLTDRDQMARYPGDRGLEFVAELDGSEVEWPKFD